MFKLILRTIRDYDISTEQTHVVKKGDEDDLISRVKSIKTPKNKYVFMDDEDHSCGCFRRFISYEEKDGTRVDKMYMVKSFD